MGEAIGQGPIGSSIGVVGIPEGAQMKGSLRNTNDPYTRVVQPFEGVERC